MKSKLLFLAFIACIKTFAQEEEASPFISKGQWFVGGTTSFSTLHDFKNPTLNFSVGGGYFVNKRIAVGLDVSYFFFHFSQMDNLQPVEYKTTRHSLLFSPIARVYLGVNKFAPFAEVGYGWNWYDTHSDLGSSSIGGTFDRNYFKAAIGFNQFFSKSFALEGIVGYYMTNETAFSNDSDGDFWSYRFGIQYYLNRKQKGITKESSETFIEKGQWMLGGTIDLSTAEFNSSISFDPEAGYFLKDNFALGIRVREQTSTYYNNLTIGPFARYYFNTKRLAPFVDGSLGWGSGESGEPYQGSSGTIVTAHASAGFNYFINDFVALESLVSYGLAGFDKPLISVDAGFKFFLVRKE